MAARSRKRGSAAANLNEPAANGNNGNNGSLNLSGLNVDTLPWSDRKLDVLRPYVMSAVQARVDLAKQMGVPANQIPREPKMYDIYLALAISTGATFVTVGRGNALESAPFVPGVAAIPTIPRGLWSTTAVALPSAEIARIMPREYWGQLTTPPTGFPEAFPGPVPPNNQDNVEGGISSFYHPAFMQVCTGAGEWLFNGFKINKANIREKAAALGINVSTIAGPTGKGYKQAESDAFKLTLYQYRGADGQLHWGLRITAGEAKSGLGEAPGKKGAEVAQLRYTLVACYIMFKEIQNSAYYHPWKMVEMVTFEACFIGAGAQSVYDIIITEQKNDSVFNVPGIQTTPVDIRRVNLPRFCAIFRLDRFRFALARTGIVDKFKNKILGLYGLAQPGARDAVGPVNRNVKAETQIPLKATLQGYNLGTNRRFNAARNRFRMAVLSTPREGSTLNENLYNVGFIRNAANAYIGGLNTGAPLSPADLRYLSQLRNAYVKFWKSIFYKSGAGANPAALPPNIKGRTRNNYFTSIAPFQNALNAYNNREGTGRANNNNSRSNISARLGPKQAITRARILATPGQPSVGQGTASAYSPINKLLKAVSTAAGRSAATGRGGLNSAIGKIKAALDPRTNVAWNTLTNPQKGVAINAARKKIVEAVMRGFSNVRRGNIPQRNQVARLVALQLPNPFTSGGLAAGPPPPGRGGAAPRRFRP